MLIESAKPNHGGFIISKLKLPLYKPCRCKYCYKDVGVQSINLMKDASVGITKDKLVPSPQTRSFVAMTDHHFHKEPIAKRDRGINAHFSPERTRIKQEDGTQTRTIKNKDIDMLVKFFDELSDIKHSLKHTQFSKETSFARPAQETTNKKEMKFQKRTTKLKNTLHRQCHQGPHVSEPKKIGDYKEIKPENDTDVKINHQTNPNERKKSGKDDKKETKNVCGSVTIAISRTRDFPEIRFQILSGLSKDKVLSKSSNATEKEKVISSFNYVQSKN